MLLKLSLFPINVIPSLSFFAIRTNVWNGAASRTELNSRAQLYIVSPEEMRSVWPQP